MKSIITGFLFVLILISNFSCLKKKYEPDGLRPDDPNLEKNIPENLIAVDFAGNPSYDVFITGQSYDTTGSVNGYWKNADWNSIADASDVFGIFADDNHVYVAGQIPKTLNGKSAWEAAYWVDGNRILPKTGANTFSEVISIASHNGNVYACGYETDETAKITDGIVWENGTPIDSFPGLYLYDLRIINGNIIVAGAAADSSGKYFNYIYKNDTLLFKTPTYGDLPITEFDASGADWVIAGIDRVYYFNGIPPDINSKDYGYLTAINITPEKKILSVGSIQAYDRNNPPSYITYYAALWRDGRFDRLETRYPGEIIDVKSIDSMEYVVGNIYSIETSNPLRKESQVSAWVNNGRYLLHGIHKWNRAHRMFVKRK